MSDRPVITVRTTPELHEALKLAAAQAETSLNAYCVDALRRATNARFCSRCGQRLLSFDTRPEPGGEYRCPECGKMAVHDHGPT